MDDPNQADLPELIPRGCVLAGKPRVAPNRKTGQRRCCGCRLFADVSMIALKRRCWKLSNPGPVWRVIFPKAHLTSTHGRSTGITSA
jgi:hypothetical protein